MKSLLRIVFLLHWVLVSGFSTNNPLFLSSENYLGSLSRPQTSEVSEGESAAVDTITSTYSMGSLYEHMVETETTSYSYEEQNLLPHTQTSNDACLATVVENTPNEHYAKNNPGAGWAGYKHRQYGGYLDNLAQNNFEDGKKADYGDDIRWGAQVYLERLGDDQGSGKVEYFDRLGDDVL